MSKRAEFMRKIQEMLGRVDPEILAFNQDEFWMIEDRYNYVERYAEGHQLPNTLISLPLVRGLFDGKYRKGTVTRRDGVDCRLPYVIHCLMVCRMLIDLQVPLSKDEEDIVLAAALCHDVIEDIPFENGGSEMVTQFGLDPRVYETVKLVSKRKDFTDEEHRAYFRHIQENRLSLLVKLSDRGNNVQDLYNMKLWKAHEYVNETVTFFFPMCEYWVEHYPELTDTIAVLREKMTTLTRATEILVTRYESKEARLLAEIEELQAENTKLRAELRAMEG